VQRTAGASGEARPIEEDACTINHPGVASPIVAEHAALRRFGVVLESGRIECRREGTEESRLIFTIDLGTDRATTMAKALCRLRQDAQATAAPDARPIRGKEGRVEAPGRLPVDDLFDRWFHPSQGYEIDRLSDP
jgi:hypothetical protein